MATTNRNKKSLRNTVIHYEMRSRITSGKQNVFTVS